MTSCSTSSASCGSATRRAMNLASGLAQLAPGDDGIGDGRHPQHPPAMRAREHAHEVVRQLVRVGGESVAPVPP